MLFHVLLACGEQTHFSAFVSPAEKIAVETKAEKCVCSPLAKVLQELRNNWLNSAPKGPGASRAVTYERELACNYLLVLFSVSSCSEFPCLSLGILHSSQIHVGAFVG